ncbi:hypothetical protein GCM10007989_07490 [Devosia pacifica]|uniref:Uncharacterized protein n=1 Tax=Devosia pacifica TaxID=1335967 RepID=A0A918VQB2_9HYPH|nr:putative Ig domain-containing protein [Devosia pacifica]GHA15233.1 hypothetical protein GCM10007989_07490 [Devosia pacifica]
MDNNDLKGSGPSFIGDLARMGGDVVGTMTQDQLKGSGPSFPADLARMGGGIVGPVVSGTPVTTATEDAAYDGFTVEATGGTAPYAYALVGDWPAGLAVNSSTGAVTGTPTEAGTFEDLSVSATDDDEEVGQLTPFTLVVAAA